MDDLALDGLVLSALLDSLLRNGFDNSSLLLYVVDNFFLNNLGDVLSDVFDGVVVGDFLFAGNDFLSLDGLVFSVDLLVGNHFGSLDGFVLHDNSFSGDLLRSLDLFVLDVLSLVGDLFLSLHSLVFNNALFVWHVLDSAVRLGGNGLLHNLDGGLLHNLDGGLLHDLNCLDWGLGVGSHWGVRNSGSSSNVAGGQGLGVDLGSAQDGAVCNGGLDDVVA